MVVHIINNILRFRNRIITSIYLISLFTNNYVYCNNYDKEFNNKLSQYAKLAKKISSKSRINNLDIEKLLNSALIVLEHIKFNNLYKKFNNIEEVVFKAVKALNYSNRFEENVIKFTISFFEIFTTLNLNNIRDIISKSPLELVPLLKEMNVFTKFITANAIDYGHNNNFSEMNGTSCRINTTKDALMKIMGALINIYLINPNTNKIYKLSNTASTFYYASYLYNQKKEKSSKILYKSAINKLQKNINNNERVSIFIDSNYD